MVSDIISIHASSNSNNKNLVNNQNLRFAKKDLVLINTSRGDIINENDLYNFFKKNPKC